MDDIPGWAFIQNPNGGGIASCGSTTVAFSDIGANCINTWFEKLCDYTFHCYIHEHPITFGQMCIYAINEYISPNMDGYDMISIVEFQLFGDPTLNIQENNPPEKPVIEGPEKGNPGEEKVYILTSTDPDGDDLAFYVNWDDGSEKDTVFISSGESINVTHVWNEQGTYTMTVIAYDEFVMESEPATLEISMSKSKVIPKPLLNILTLHPRLYPLLIQLLDV
jgi:hypothetical protein